MHVYDDMRCIFCAKLEFIPSVPDGIVPENVLYQINLSIFIERDFNCGSSQYHLITLANCPSVRPSACLFFLSFVRDKFDNSFFCFLFSGKDRPRTGKIASIAGTKTARQRMEPSQGEAQRHGEKKTRTLSGVPPCV